MSDYLADVQRYDAAADADVVQKIVKHLGIALRSKDASLVSCSSKDELSRVRDSWLKKKLGRSDDDKKLDSVIKEVCETMKADKRKNRVTFYYLLGRSVGFTVPFSMFFLIVPIAVVVAWLYAFMYFAGFGVNVATATIGAISIGIGIDFAIQVHELLPVPLPE